jgi:SrtB family sortase
MKNKSSRFNRILISCFTLAAIIGLLLIAMYAISDDISDSPVIEPPDIEISKEEDDKTEESEPSEAAPLVIRERFEALYEQNNDLVGWIRVPNTVIDYPVVYGADNSFYLRHDFNKRRTDAGTIFLDMSAGILENNQSLSLYGHYMRNGTMFSALHNYKELEYYKEYPLFEFSTLYEDGFYKIFSVFYMAGNRTDELFYYYPFSTYNTEEAFMDHVNQLLVRSIFTTTVDVALGDQLVLMTVCTYETDNLRLIVAGRKMRQGESFVVNTKDASLNPGPLYPQKWYDTLGGKPPPLP